MIRITLSQDSENLLIFHSKDAHERRAIREFIRFLTWAIAQHPQGNAPPVLLAYRTRLVRELLKRTQATKTAGIALKIEVF